MCGFVSPRRQHIRSLALNAEHLPYDYAFGGYSIRSSPRLAMLLGLVGGGPLTSLELRLGPIDKGVGDWMFHLPQLQRLRLRCPPAAEYTRGTGCELRAAFSRLASLTHLSLRGFCDLTFDRGALPASLRELEVSDCWVKCTAGGGIVRDTFGRALAAAASRVQGLQSLTVEPYVDDYNAEAQELGLGHLTERFSGITHLSLRVSDSLPSLEPLGSLSLLRALDFGLNDYYHKVAEEDAELEWDALEYLSELASLTQLTSLSVSCGLTYFPLQLEPLWQSTSLKASDCLRN